MYRKTAKKLLKFIEKSPTAFQAVTEMTKIVKFMSNTLFFVKTDGILLLFYTNLTKIPEPEGEPA